MAKKVRPFFNSVPSHCGGKFLRPFVPMAKECELKFNNNELKKLPFFSKCEEDESFES